jgi:hypothetical protein
VSRLAGLFVLVLACSSGHLLLTAAGRGAAMLARDLEASRHPRVPAVITRFDVHDLPRERPDRFEANLDEPFDLEYRYRLEGVEYVGHRYRHLFHGGGVRHARELQARHPVGSRVDVRVDPRNHASSVVTAGLRGMDLLALQAGAVMIVVELALAFAGLAMLTGWTGPPAVQRFKDGTGATRVRVMHLPAAFIFFIALVMTLLVLQVPTALLLRERTPMAVAIGIVLLTFLVPAWLARRRARRIRAGDWDFRIDPRAGTLTLPPALNHTVSDSWIAKPNPAVIPRSSIVGLRVGPRLGSEGGFSVTLVQVDESGTRRELVFRPTNAGEKQAAEIVRALAEELGMDRMSTSP